MKRNKITNNKILSVYEAKGCNVSATCTALRIDRKTLLSWRKSDEMLNDKMTELEESLIDFSESKLIEQISEGNLTAIIFHLKTKGKSRGYTEASEVNANVKSFQLRPLTEDELETLAKLNG